MTLDATIFDSIIGLVEKIIPLFTEFPIAYYTYASILSIAFGIFYKAKKASRG